MTGRNNTDRPFYPLRPARSIRSSTVPLHATLPTKTFLSFHGRTFKGECFKTRKFRNRKFHEPFQFLLLQSMIQIFTDALVKSNLIFRCFSNIVDEGLEEENHIFFFHVWRSCSSRRRRRVFFTRMAFFPSFNEDSRLLNTRLNVVST